MDQTMGPKMARKWFPTGYPGVRYRQHPKRKHGVQLDRYFSIYYRCNGKRKEQGCGWASQGWTAKRSAAVLAEIESNITLGEGPQSLSEKREREIERREKERKERERLATENVTFFAFFEKEYLPAAKMNKKPESSRKAVEHVKNWIGPAVGQMPMKNIRPMHLQRIYRNMGDAGRSPRSIQYVFATFRAVWNQARNNGVVQSQSPTKALSLPKVSNQRKRYLTQTEAEALLRELGARSPQLYRIALLSLQTGMRFSEITGLTWGCVALEKSRIDIMNAKGEKDRSIPMTAEVKSMFASMTASSSGELVFESRKGGRIGKVSKSFDRAVKALSFNDNVKDPKLKFTFHCLRHTFASWLVEEGVDLYLVQKLLGHSTPVVTQRYAHVADNMLRKAVQTLETGMKQKQPENVPNLEVM